MTERTPQRKTRVGRVVSDAMDKTVVVAVERRVHHRLYHKSVRRAKKFKAHDEANEYRVGDVVRLMETRPLSRTKRWRVVQLLHRDEASEIDVAVEDAAEVPEPVAEPEAVPPEAEASADEAVDETAAGSSETGEGGAAVAEEPVADASGTEDEGAGVPEEPVVEPERFEPPGTGSAQPEASAEEGSEVAAGDTERADESRGEEARP